MNNTDIISKAIAFKDEHNPDGLVPFPFESAAKNLGDIDIVYLNLLDDVSGAIFYQDNRFKIVINNSKHRVRQYFTLAHEFAHYQLHREWLIAHPNDGFIEKSANFDNLSALMRPDTPPLSPDEIKREKEANNFAAEILMPKEKVKELWNLTHDVSECARAFQVSISAMAIRLEKIGLAS